jgi:hypothetical protein
VDVDAAASATLEQKPELSIEEMVQAQVAAALAAMQPKEEPKKEEAPAPKVDTLEELALL